MNLTKQTKATTTYYDEYTFVMSYEEAQALFDVTGNVGGLSDDGEGNLLPRGHINNIRYAMRDQFGFINVNKTRSSMYFIEDKE